jgi:hypothetical protein
MNVFFLDRDVKKCARYHCDAHVVKMLLEYAQLLSTAVRLSGIDEGYKPTHVNHPAAIWVRESISHWNWLKRLALALEDEWRYRYEHGSGDTHKSADVIRKLPTPVLNDIPWCDPPQAMPQAYRCDDVVEAYREYYRRDKSRFATWTRRLRPKWMINPDLPV